MSGKCVPLSHGSWDTWRLGRFHAHRQRPGLESTRRGQSRGRGDAMPTGILFYLYFFFLNRVKIFPVITPCGNPPRPKCHPLLGALCLLRGETRELLGRVWRISHEPGQERKSQRRQEGAIGRRGLVCSRGGGRWRRGSQPCSLHLLPPGKRNQGWRRAERLSGTRHNGVRRMKAARQGRPGLVVLGREGPRPQAVRSSPLKPDQGRMPSIRTRGIVTQLL